MKTTTFWQKVTSGLRLLMNAKTQRKVTNKFIS